MATLSRTIRKAYWRMSISKMPKTIIAYALILIVIFLLGGGIYDIVTMPPPYWVYGGTINFFYPSLGFQLLGESVIVMILYAIGTAGLLIIYHSIRYVNNPRQAAIALFVGLTFFLIAFILIESIIYNYKMYFYG